MEKSPCNLWKISSTENLAFVIVPQYSLSIMRMKRKKSIKIALDRRRKSRGTCKGNGEGRGSGYMAKAKWRCGSKRIGNGRKSRRTE